MTTLDARFRGRQGRFELEVAFTIPARGVTALFGPSGCGKTTVLRCLAGLQRLQEGYLRVDGRVWQDDQIFLPPHRRAVGYVFQEASLFPHLSVAANLLYGFKRSRTRDKSPVFDEIVALLAMDHLLERSPRRLSGGERQRVAIGRALLSGPEILLMDEPLAAIDRMSKADILPYLEKLHDYLKIPILYVSHDVAEVERLADHMVLMAAGKVRAAGPLERLISDPSLPFAQKPDAAAVMDGRVISYDARYGLSTLAVAGGIMVVPGRGGEEGAVRRLRIFASDVGLCRGRAPEGLSILNMVAARILAATPVGLFQVNVFLGFGADGEGARFMARITRKSWETLSLQVNQGVVALIKSVALVDEA